MLDRGGRDGTARYGLALSLSLDGESASYLPVSPSGGRDGTRKMATRLGAVDLGEFVDVDVSRISCETRCSRREAPVRESGVMRMVEGKAILIVEDEPMVAMMLDDLLTEMGCRVVGPASNLSQARELLELDACDAAIVDLNLNGTMAHPLIETLRGRGVPVIVATGYGTSVSNLPEGCRILAKPYAIQHVEEALRSCLAGRC